MAMTPYSGNTDVIAALGTTPQERGLTTQKFKDKFDEAFKRFITEYFNTTHIGEIDAHLADNVTDADGAHGLKIESGTFTPVLAGSTVAGNHTYGYQTGIYRVIGSRVFCDITMHITGKDAAMDGNVKITGFPFIAKPATNHRYSGTIGGVSNVNIGASKCISVVILGNTTEALLYKINDNAPASQVPASDIGNLWLAMHINYEKA